MRRRDFIKMIGGAAVAWPVEVRGQGERVRRVGMLLDGAADDQVREAYVAAFRNELARLGWVEGRNLQIDRRFGAGDPDRLRAYAVELINLTPDVIVTSTSAATRAAQQQTQTIPIVIAGAGDPIVNGIVKNLARPEGNTTGVSNVFASMGSKWLELLKQAAPKVEQVALIYNNRVIPDERGYMYFPSIKEAASALNVHTTRIGYRDAVDLVHAIDAFG